MEPKQTDTVVYKYPIEATSKLQEIVPNDPKNERIYGPISIGYDLEKQLCIWCIVERGEQHPKNYHIYIRLALTNQPILVPEATFLGTIINDAFGIIHAFWWSMSISNEPAIDNDTLAKHP